MKRYLTLALPLALATCARPPQGEPATPRAAELPAVSTYAAAAPALSANHWRLAEAKNAQGQRIDALFVNADKPVQLDFAEGRVGVSNTCNRIGGAYSVAGDELEFDHMVSTLMACTDAKLTALDQEVTKRLEGSLKFTQSATTLALTTASGDVLTFTGEATAETRYDGSGQTMFLEVAAQTKACSHPLVPDKQCLQVREQKYGDKGIKTGAEAAFENFHGDIEGYAHEPGIRNVLRVKRYPVRNPLAEGSSSAYELERVVESEIVKP